MNGPAERRAGARARTLAPGQWWFGGPADGVRRVDTLLGSCVALTFWHARSRCGGMCHFVLPRRRRNGAPPDGRYGEEALELLEAAAQRHGLSLGDCEVGLFGGANMFPDDPRATIDIGAHNVDAACELLERRGLLVMRRDHGGREHRVVTLDMACGALNVRLGAPVSAAMGPR